MDEVLLGTYMYYGIPLYSVEGSILRFCLEVTPQHISEARRIPTEGGGSSILL